MGSHFCEVERFAGLNRRGMLKAIAGGAAAGIPSVSQAKPLTDKEQFDQCIEQLQVILRRMHPLATVCHQHYLLSAEDGSWRLSMQGDVVYQPFSGDGLYELSLGGYFAQFWLIEDCRRNSKTGLPIPGMTFYWATQWHDNAPLGEAERISQPRIVRKLRRIVRDESHDVSRAPGVTRRLPTDEREIESVGAV